MSRPSEHEYVAPARQASVQRIVVGCFEGPPVDLAPYNSYVRPRPSASAGNPGPYGSAKDLPSYQEMLQQLQGMKLLTRFIARDQRPKVLELEQDVNRLVKVVDEFYDRLGPRNWIFHDRLDLSKIGAILAETSDPEDAESRLIGLYRDTEATKFWIMGLRGHEGFRARLHQIERARDHYDAGQFDSCVLHRQCRRSPLGLDARDGDVWKDNQEAGGRRSL